MLPALFTVLLLLTSILSGCSDTTTPAATVTAAPQAVTQSLAASTGQVTQKTAAITSSPTPQPTPRPRFGFNAATIEFQLSGDKAGKQVLHVEDWGNRMLWTDSTQRDADGQPLQILWHAGKLRIIDHAAKRIVEQDTQGTYFAHLSQHVENLPALNHREAGVLAIAGQNCTVFKAPADGPSYCHWKGLDLQQSRRDADGKKWQRQAVKIKIGAGLPEALHSLPENYRREAAKPIG